VEAKGDADRAALPLFGGGNGVQGPPDEARRSLAAHARQMRHLCAVVGALVDNAGVGGASGGEQVIITTLI